MAEREMSKELQALLVDDGEQAIDGLLRRALEPYARFTREGRVITKEQFLKLSDPSKLLVFLLARQAMVRLKLPSAAAESTADTMHSECGVPLKSAREHLSRLKSRRLLDKNDAGYFVPIWAVSNVVDLISGKAAD